MLSEYESEKLAAIKSHLSCPLCHQIFVSPCFLSGCGHTFCGACLKQRFSWRNECPQCKASARPSDLTSSLALNAIVSAYLRFDARAAPLQLPLPIVKNVSEIMDESGVNYSSTSVIEIHEDSDHEGTCSVELEDPDQAKASLAALTMDVIKEGDDCEEDESIWTSLKLPLLRESNGSKVFSELIHRKKKLKTFSNGDIRIFAVDSRALTSSSLGVKKPQSNHTATATAFESCSVVTTGTAVDKNDGVITTKEQCSGPFYSHKTEAINLTQDTSPECSEKSRSSALFTQTIEEHNKTDTQILEGVGLLCKKERAPLEREQKKQNSVHVGAERKIQNNENMIPTQKIVPVEEFCMRKDQNMDKPSSGNQHLSDHQNILSTSSRLRIAECSAEEAENVPKAVKNILPPDHQYYSVDLTGSTVSHNDNSDENVSVKKKDISHEGSELSLVISLDDNCENENTDYFYSNYDHNCNEINVIKHHGSTNKKTNDNKVENKNREEKEDENITENESRNNNFHSTIRGPPYDIIMSKINDGCVHDDYTDNNDDDNDNETDEYQKLCVNADDKCSNEFYSNNDDDNYNNNSSSSSSRSVDNDNTNASDEDNNPLLRSERAPPNIAGAGACVGASSMHQSHLNSSSMLIARSNDNCSSNNSSSSSKSSSSSSDVQGYRGRDRGSYHSPNTNTSTIITINSNSTPSSSSSSSSRYSSSSGPHHHPNASASIPDPDPRSDLLRSKYGRPIDSSYTDYNPEDKSNNLDGRLDTLDGVQDSQVTYTTDDSYNDECHTINWTQNPDCSANGENSCADMVDKVRYQTLYYRVFGCVQ